MPDLPGRPAAVETTSGRTPARVLLVASALFIIYGSLFPFEFASVRLPLSSFLDEYDLFARRGDALENIALFIPLGFALQTGLVSLRARVLGAALAILVLAIGIQLAQLYLPSRTASVSDAVWNTVGLVGGMLGAMRIQALIAAQLARSDIRQDNFLPWLVVLWLCYESFPFLPTLDLGLLRAHVKTVVYAPPFESTRLVLHCAPAALATIALVHSGWLRRPGLAVLVLGGAALGLETCVAYGQLRRETLLGIVLGLATGWLLARAKAQRPAGWAMILALAMYLFTVLTPYRGQPANGVFNSIPFSLVLENGILGSLPPIACEALAIGMLLWAGLRCTRGPSSVWCVLVILTVATLEWVRVAVAGYQGDTTSLCLVFTMAPWAAANRTI